MVKKISKLGGPILLAFFLVVTACSPQNKNNNPTQSPTQEATAEQAAPTSASHLIELSPFPTNTQAANGTAEATSTTPNSPGANSPTSQPTGASNNIPTIQANPTGAAVTSTKAVAATVPAGSGSGPTDKYQYISQNIPDKTQVRPGVEITITWAVKNIGTVAWTTDYTLRYFAGPSNSEPNTIKFPKTIPPNSIVNLTAVIKAPKTLGDYDSWWKLTNAQEQNFGDVDLEFTVTNSPKNGTSPTPSS